jgi:hypothetical protein
MHQAREIARVPLSLLTRLRLVLFGHEDLAVGSVARPVEFALPPDMSLTAALEGFLREQATVLPVTPGQWRNTLLGEVARSDVLLAIQDRLTYPK